VDGAATALVLPSTFNLDKNFGFTRAKQTLT